MSACLLAAACKPGMGTSGHGKGDGFIEIMRYDRLQSRYLTTGDFSALQEMNTTYPQQTRTLIEDILELGPVDDPSINNAMLDFYQDSTLQAVIVEAEAQYASMDDIGEKLGNAFGKLSEMIPGLETPSVYAQIGALGQSVVIGEHSIGISLDKYLGADYPPYLKYYQAQARLSMQRRNIVPDCVSFYLLSLYPMDGKGKQTQREKDLHMGKIMWVANKALGEKFFRTKFVEHVGKYMASHPGTDMAELLENNDYTIF